MVTRLLRERDARLSAASVSDAADQTTQSSGGGGRAERRENVVAVAAAPGGRGSRGVVAAIPDKSCASAMNAEAGGGGDGGPSSTRGDIFFASDLLHPGRTDDGNGPNGYFHVGTPPAENDKTMEALLLRLRGDDGSDHADDHDYDYDYDDIHSNEVNRDKIDNHRLRWMEEDVALMRPPPPPPSPPPPPGPNGLSSPRLRHTGLTAGSGVPDEELVHSQRRRRGSPESRVAAGRTGDGVFDA